MVGAGQLARMTCPAATELGIGFRLLADGPDDSAAKVWPDVEVGDYRSLDDLQHAFSRFRFRHNEDIRGQSTSIVAARRPNRYESQPLSKMT